jgi:hypothetical protein
MEIKPNLDLIYWIIFAVIPIAASICYYQLKKQLEITPKDILLSVFFSVTPPFNLMLVFIWFVAFLFDITKYILNRK